jgi:predicted GNAT family N-acyltransferase
LEGHKAILHAQLDKKAFYEKNGYSILDGTIDYDEGHPHIMMVKELKKNPYKRHYYR